MANELYNMKLHDVLTPSSPNNVRIIRVPGGWIYQSFSKNGIGGYDMTSCYVPYHNEFQTMEIT